MFWIKKNKSKFYSLVIKNQDFWRREKMAEE